MSTKKNPWDVRFPEMSTKKTPQGPDFREPEFLFKTFPTDGFWGLSARSAGFLGVFCPKPGGSSVFLVIS